MGGKETKMTAEERAAWEFFWEVFGNPEMREALRFVLTNHVQMRQLLEAAGHERH